MSGEFTPTDCLNCGGDGHLPGSLGHTTCPGCNGTGNQPTRTTADVFRAFLIGVGVGALLMAGTCMLTVVFR